MVARLTLTAAILPLAAAIGATGSSAFADPASDTYRAAIYSVGPDGHGRRLVAVPDPPVLQLARSPDGARIAFAHPDDGAVYVAAVSGANPVRIAPPGGAYYGLTFSPDGTKLAFSSRGPSCGPRCQILGSLYVVDAEGGDLHRIAERADAPSWSPDGRRIAYRGDLGVYVVSATGGSAKLVARSRQLGGSSVYLSHVWAPRGQRIAYIGNKGGYGVPCFVDADGSRRRCLSGFSAVRKLVWSQDGRRIAFAYVPGGQLAVVGADGRGLRRLHVGVDAARPLAWSPDGRRIAYTYGVTTKRMLVRSLTATGTSKWVTSAPPQGQLSGDVRWRAGRISYVVYERS